MTLQQMPHDFSFSKNEEEILENWEKQHIYQKLLTKNKDGPLFRFMDGPPFVSSNSLHYGHIHVGYIKDSILRFMRMFGYNVLNQIGFDCHGLPIEQVVEKRLGLKTKQEVEKFGIAEYNKECKQIIHSFAGSWQDIYNRIGRWVDFTNEYKTLDTNFMETVWWVFKQLWDKDLVYKGYKIMAFSTACATALSNFEAKQNYKDVTDMSVYVKFKLVDEDVYLTVWTTTPWTLPSNLALCVNPDLVYLYVRDLQDGTTYIVAEEAINNVYTIPKKKKDYEQPYEIIKKVKGYQLKDLEYVPMFDYFSKDRRFRILADKFVTATDGTGIVHLAPSFGEEDLEVCIKNKVLDIQDVGEYCPIDDDGFFTDPVEDYKGVQYNTANLVIIETLKEENKLIKKVPITHSYPFCWRTDTPLMYRAVSGLFIKVTSIKDKIIANNKKVNWVPDHVGKGRFNQWLENTKDWGVSRSRFFGTPIPVWISEDGEEMVCVGSIDELVELANLKERPDDLHREFIDKIKIPSKQGKGMLTRVEDVFDCWFESGSVPYAQIHYPFENKEVLDNTEYLSDFICEGIDQTRGWFYTLMVLSTALFDKPAFKNVICSGLILGEDGQKLSKRLENYVKPEKILSQYSADAARLYLISSPAARAGSFKFSEDDILQVIKKLNQWYNGLKFFLEHSIKYKKDGHTVDLTLYQKSTNIMDIWILARVKSMIILVKSSMDNFEIYKIYQYMLNFIEDLTNWYIKFNRNRLKGKNCSLEDQSFAISTLYKVLLTFSKITAPFTPYLSETMYQTLKPLLKDSQESVHMCEFPNKDNFTVDSEVERKMSSLQDIANTVRSLRCQSKTAMSGKVTINLVTLATDNEQLIDDIKELEQYMLEEINSLGIKYLSTKGLVKYKAVPDRKSLGQKFRKLAGFIVKLLDMVDQDTLTKFYNKSINEITLTLEEVSEKVVLTRDDLDVTVELNYKLSEHEYAVTTSGTVVIIDAEYTTQVKELYKRKLFIRAVQDMRKETSLHPWDKISIYYESEDKELINIINKNSNNISNDLGKKIYEMIVLDENNKETLVIDKVCDVDGSSIKILIKQ